MPRGRALSSALLGLALCVTACAERLDAPVFPLDACERLRLVDIETGASVRGAEDFAIDPEGRVLFVSAYDRWAVEDAVRAGDEPPEGGVYKIPFENLPNRTGEVGEIRVQKAVAPSGALGGFRPHGLAWQAGEEGGLYVINRRYVEVGGRWALQEGVDVFDRELIFTRSVAAPELCRANDLVAFEGERLAVTRDHGACGSFAGVEDVLGLKRAEWLWFELPNSKTRRGGGGIGFANGIAASPGHSALAVAATRQSAVFIYDLNEHEARTPRRLSVPGGPDNLIWSSEDELIAAVHPKLMKMGFFRKRWLGAKRAPSRVVSLDPKSGAVTLLFDDPKGDQFSGATVAVEAEGRLVLGGVAEEGLLICTQKRMGDDR